MAPIAESLTQMIPPDELPKYLRPPMTSFVISALLSDSGGGVLKSSHRDIEQLQALLESFCLATLKIIYHNFGNFGLTIWCPLLAEVCVDLGISCFKLVYAEFERNGGANGVATMMKFHSHSFHVFNQVNVGSLPSELGIAVKWGSFSARCLY